MAGLVLTLCLLPACNGFLAPDQGEGNVIISLPGAAGGAVRNVKPSDDLAARMAYTITCTGPGGVLTQTLAPGTAEAVFRLAVGNWTIEVTAFEEGVAIGGGSAQAAITGRNGQNVSINLDFYQEGDYEAEFGPDAEISGIFTVATPAEWAALSDKITAAGNYIVNVTGSVIVPYSSSTTFTGNNITVSIRGGGTLALDSSGGSLLTIGANQTVILRNVTLEGIAANTAALVHVDGGSLAMHSGAVITGNINGGGNGGGVYVDGGSITLYGGKISENTVSGSNVKGGGVYCDGAVLELRGGEISGNSIEFVTTGAGGSGAGICAENSSTVRIYSGSVKNNSGSAQGTGDSGIHGTGISMSNSDLLMEGGFVEGNTADSQSSGGSAGTLGAGVSMHGNGSFTMKGGAVRGNYASYGNGNNWSALKGGGVYLTNTVVFTMEGGVISGNTLVSPQANHEISAGYYYLGAVAGGVYIAVPSVTVIKTGGIIYGSEAVGNDADGFPLRNVAMHNGADIDTAVVVDTGGTPPSPYAGGHAIMIVSSTDVPVKWRDATADENTDLNSSNFDNWSN
ncbi:MAG: hypothetical protein LBF95_11245 [Treponema sp.]|nr:hypothetical protein [Treponema sp.]